MNAPIEQTISAATGLSVRDVEQLVRTAPHRYKVYQVPKKSGMGMRTIAQPARELKRVQLMVIRELLGSLPIHKAAHAYTRDRGIRTNAEQHRQGTYLLKIDFENFFPSIRPCDLRAHVCQHVPDRFSDADMSALERLLFWAPKEIKQLCLSIGAPSSPFLSNTILHPLDCRLQAIADSSGVTYTRYADDLTFSTSSPNKLHAIVDAMPDALAGVPYPTLRINSNKTIHTSKRYRRLVTGITLTPTGQLSIGRDRKRLIRSMVHRATHSELTTEELQKLRGLLAFAHDLEPTFASKMRRRMLDNTHESRQLNP